jgi:hypothetical protein
MPVRHGALLNNRGTPGANTSVTLSGSLYFLSFIWAFPVSMRLANHFLTVVFLGLPLAVLCQQSSPSGGVATPFQAGGKATSDPAKLPGVDLAAKAAQDEADRYMAEVAAIFNNDKFNELDQMAAAARSSKSRLGGGAWKLHTLYSALTGPPEAVAKDDSAWEGMASKLQAWRSQKPESVTAQVALAGLYVNYAWKARGGDYADKIGNENWKLFGERLELAKNILAAAAALHQKCPEWFWQMQTVALGEGWSKEEVFDLFQHAIAFEPGYQYYYRAMARYLMPKWYGEEGDAEAFAEKVSSQVGGLDGGVIYYEIATELICDCGHEFPFSKLSWQKVRLGYADLEKLYGTSSHKLNQFAYLAVHSHDRDTARQAFQRIGDNWDKGVWRTRKYFDDCKVWATRSDGLQAALIKAEANLQTTEGRQYDAEISKEFPEKLSDAMKRCVEQNRNDLQSFNLLLLMGGDGAPQTILHQPVTAVSACLLPHLKSVIFSPPPQAQYWVKVSMNLQP